MAKIVVTIPGGRRKTYMLDEAETIIGRSPKCTVVIEDKKASREHLRIQMIANVITAEDLDSSNGTMFLNQKITKKTIDDRDILTIGEVKIQFFFDDNANPDIALSKKKRSFEQAAIERQLVQINSDGSVTEVEGESYYIEILDGDFNGLKIKLEGKLTIGRHQQNVLVLTGTKVSSQHAIIDFLGDETYITDLGSTNGTLVNTKKIDPNSAFKLHHGAIIEIGEHRISFNVPASMRHLDTDTTMMREEELSVLAAHSLIFVGGQRDGERIPMTKRITIGRKDFNNICLPSPQVSGEHCEIFFDENRFIVKDISSANGTFVNGRKIREYKVLNPGDMISLGDTMLAFDKAGEALDIDENIKKIKAWSMRKIQRAIVISVLLLLLALSGLYIITDLTLSYLVESKAAKEGQKIENKINAGIETAAGFTAIPELSFEYDPEIETKIPGWDLFIHDRSCDFVFDKEVKCDGKWSLSVIPKKARNPRAEIRLTTNNSLNQKMKKVMEYKALQISAHVSAQDFLGVMGLRVIWQTQLNPRTETVKYIESNDIKGDKFYEMKCSVAVPRDAIGFGIEVFVRGNVSKIWFDKVIVKEAGSAEMSIFTPILFDKAEPSNDITGGKSLSMRIDKPMSGDIKRGDLNVISGISPVLLSNRDQYIDENSKDDAEFSYIPSMTLDDNPFLTVTELDNNTLVYSLQLYSDFSNKILPMTFDYSRKNDCYEILPDLDNVDVNKNECIALRMNLLEPYNITPGYHLRLFDADNSSYAFLKESATVQNVSEICWGNYFGYTGIVINPSATVYFEKKEIGYEITILLKGLGTENGKHRIQFYGYSVFEYQMKQDVLRSGMKMLERKENFGNVLILAQRIMKAFEADKDFVEKVNNELEFNQLNNEQETLYNRVKRAWDYIQTRNHSDANEAIDRINDGIKAAEEFILKYSALYKQDEIKDKMRDLRNEKPRYTQMLTKDEKQKRLDDAQELLYRAKKFMDEQNSEYSLLQAMLFLKALINKYLPVMPEADDIDYTLNGVIENAQKYKRDIEDMWNDSEAENKYVTAKIEEIKTALNEKNFALAQEIVRKIFLKYPFTKHRDEIEGLIYGN